MIDDLRHFKADRDPFVIIPPDLAIVLLCVVVLLVAVLEKFL